jgi:AcrR family transcriptional regulator
VEPTADRLFVAAAQLFRECGYAAATTREISARLGINKASLYHYISGKEDLLHGICIESLRRVHRDVLEAVSSETEPSERIRRLCQAHLTSMLTDLDMHTTMLLELKSLTGTRYEEVREARDLYEGLVTTTVAEAQQAGSLRTDIDAKHLTIGLLNMLNWTLTWYKPKGDDSPEMLAASLAELYLNGASVPANRSKKTKT